VKLNITKENVNLTQKLGQVTFGSCVFVDGQYYILSSKDGSRGGTVLLINLSSGNERSLSFDEQVYVVEDASIYGTIKI
jgi:hypothetical protein